MTDTPGPGYIYVKGWERFQHPDVVRSTRMPWIRNYVDLLENEDYLDLTASERALLECIWKWSGLVGNGRVPAKVSTLRNRFRLRNCNLEPLIQAGFIEVRASKAQATRKQSASTEQSSDLLSSEGVSSSASTSRERNEEWDALADVFGYSPVGGEAKEWGKLCVQLRDFDATPATIAEVSRRYEAHMPSVAKTPRALVKHYQRLLAGPPEPSANGRRGYTAQELAEMAMKGTTE